jgi:prolyl-tRNA editing enzyme YbaK/EbsC (Cys-tRNA(Pro) deacylase)
MEWISQARDDQQGIKEKFVSIEKVRAYLEPLGVADRIVEFDASSATVELAAQVLGCEPGMIAKSLAFDVKGEAVLVVVAGDEKIDNHKFKAQFGTKPKMLKVEETELRIGHAVGGVCPFAVKEGVRVFMDKSLNRFEVVYPAAGTSNSCIWFTPAELERCSAAAGWVDVCKD